MSRIEAIKFENINYLKNRVETKNAQKKYVYSNDEQKIDKEQLIKELLAMAAAIKEGKEPKEVEKTPEEVDKKFVEIKLSKIAEKIEKAEKNIEEEKSKITSANNDKKNKSIFSLMSENFFRFSAENRIKNMQNILSNLQKQYATVAIQLS